MKWFFTKLFQELSSLLKSITISLEDNYSKIFRGGLFLFGISLAGLSQIIPVFLDYEYQAMELKYEFEEKSKTSLSVAKCDNFESLYKICNLGKYKLDISFSAMNLLIKLTGLLFYVGFSMVALSILGYIAKATSSNKQ